jgi:hypothetical protein
VQLPDEAMDALLASHRVDAKALRADDFSAFYQARKAALLALIEGAMGKASLVSLTTDADAVVDDADLDEM